MNPNIPHRVPLEFVGRTATLSLDHISGEGYILSIDGAEQSHVDLTQPTTLRYEYLQRIAAILTTRPEAARRVLHLGGGALTLARWCTATWGGLRQVVVDIEPALLRLVSEVLPLAHPEQVQLVAGPADAFVHSHQDPAATPWVDMAGQPVPFADYDAVIVDIFAGADSAPELQSEAFLTALAELLTPEGEVLINIGDEADQRFSAGLLRTAHRVFGSVIASADQRVLNRSTAGNTIAWCGVQPPTQDRLTAVAAAGPHPNTLLSGADLARFYRGVSAK